MSIKTFFTSFLKERLINRRLNNFLIEKEQQSKGSKFDIDKLKNIGVLLDMDKYNNPKFFNKLAKELGVTKSNLHIIFCTSLVKNNNNQQHNIFYKNEYSWRGSINNKKIKEFLEMKYDLLINYFDDERFHFLLASSKTKSDLRVGFPKINYGYNDLIISVPPDNFELFKKELFKYIKILNRQTV